MAIDDDIDSEHDFGKTNKGNLGDQGDSDIGHAKKDTDFDQKSTKVPDKNYGAGKDMNKNPGDYSGNKPGENYKK